jgi:hypothetical protein
MTQSTSMPSSLAAYADELLVSLPLLEDIMSHCQRPYLAQLREWAELVLELAEDKGAHLPRFAGELPRLY